MITLFRQEDGHLALRRCLNVSYRVLFSVGLPHRSGCDVISHEEVHTWSCLQSGLTSTESSWYDIRTVNLILSDTFRSLLRPSVLNDDTLLKSLLETSGNERVYESASWRDPASCPMLTETTAPCERNTQLI